MNPAADSNLWLFAAAGAIFGPAIIASMFRIMLGPSLADRIVALDLLGFLVIAAICVYAIVTSTPALLSVCLVAALILFLGTAALARYLERSAPK